MIRSNPRATQRLLLLSNSVIVGGRYLEHARTAIMQLFGARVRRVLFVPYAAVQFSLDDYAARVRAALAEMGFGVESVHQATDPVGAVEAADAIAVGGGNTFHLLRELYRHNLLGPIRARVHAGMPYLGWSAGSNVACPTIRTTNDMPIVEPPSLDALGLVPFQINPHYTEARLEGHGGETRDERLLEFVIANPGVQVVGLREGTLLRVEGDSIQLLGDRPARIFQSGRDPRDVAQGAPLQFLFG